MTDVPADSSGTWPVEASRDLYRGDWIVALRQDSIRRPEDLMVMPGVPVIGVLQPAGSRRPVFRRLLMIQPPAPSRLALPRPGMQA